MRKTRTLVIGAVFTGILGMSVPVIAQPDGLAQGAAFEQLPMVTDTEVYSYIPSVINEPSPMMTPVFFVFADQPYENEEAAWDKLCQSGLKDLAEEKRGGVMLINPTADTWSDADENVYAQLLDIICPERGAEPELAYTTYLNKFYVIGEGSGARFITEYLASQKNRATHIAGTLLIDAQMPEKLAGNDSEPIPAYIAGSDDSVVDYYKELNGVDTTEEDGEKTVYYAEDYSAKKVIVNTDKMALNAETVEDAWTSLMQRTMRHPISKPVWSGGHLFTSENNGQVIQELPVPEELKLVYNEDCRDEKLPEQSRWYEWIPEEALSEGNTESYPLVVVYHGKGDHPVYEAESNGWIALAGQERFILISSEDNEDPDNNMSLIKYITEKYPVDESRIYMGGFSAGAANTLRTAEKYLDTFAAVAPLAPPSESQGFDYEAIGWNAEEADLPMFLSCSTNEKGTSGENPNGDGSYVMLLQETFNSVMKLNEIDALIDTTKLDYETYKYYGYDASEYTKQFTTIHGADMRLTSYANADGIDMLRYNVMWDGDHNHYTEYAVLVWDFWKNFSRDTETKALVYEAESNKQS